MKICTLCSKEIESVDFCSAAHKMAYRRRSLIKDTIDYVKKENVIIPKKIIEEKKIKMCHHGAMVGLCRHGCKK